MEDKEIFLEKEPKIKQDNNLMKKIVIRFIIAIVSFILLVLFRKIKPEVNNGITELYYVISMIFSVLLSIVFPFLFIKSFPEKSKETYFNVIDIFYVFTLACMVFQFVFAFVYFKANVDGDSMFPTLNNNETLIVRSNNDIDRFDIVVVAYYEEYNEKTSGLSDGELLVKRIIGMPGDTLYIENGVLFLNNQMIDEDFISENNVSFYFENCSFKDKGGLIKDEERNCYVIKEGYYFVLGDNRGISNDSRRLGLFAEEQIIGRVDFRVNNIFSWEKLR